MSFNKATGCGNILNFIQIDTQICKKMDTKVLTSNTAVTFNEGHGHPNSYQNVEHSSLYHHTKLERNWSVNVSIKANVEVFFTKWHKYCSLLWILHVRNEMSARFITSTSLNSKQNSFQINIKLCEIIGIEVFAFLHFCDLESRSRSIRQVSKCGVQLYLSLKQVWIKLIGKCPNACQHLPFLTQSVKQQLFSLFQSILI